MADLDEQDGEQMPVWSAALVAALVLLAIVGGILWLTRDTGPDPGPTVAPTAIEPSGTVDPSTPGPMATEPSDALGPSEVIPGWSSTDVAGLVVPVVTEAGPHDLSDGRARVFERTELGAVMAAAHLTARVSGYAGPDIYEPTIAEQVVAGDNQQRLLAQAMATYVEASREQGRDDPRSQAVLRGYRVPTYSAEAATVELWSEAMGPNGLVRVAVPTEVVWREDQWMLLPGSDPQAGRQLVETGQFIEFPPEVR